MAAVDRVCRHNVDSMLARRAAVDRPREGPRTCPVAEPWSLRVWSLRATSVLRLADAGPVQADRLESGSSSLHPMGYVYLPRTVKSPPATDRQLPLGGTSIASSTWYRSSDLGISCLTPC